MAFARTAKRLLPRPRHKKRNAWPLTEKVERKFSL